MTKSTKHPIKTNGLVNILQRIGYASRLEEVNFVFVVPKDDSTFEKQEFKYELCADSVDVLSKPVTAMSGIGKVLSDILFNQGIRTVGDLCRAADSGAVVGRYKNIVEKFRRSAQNTDLVRSLESIPQYCMELII